MGEKSTKIDPCINPHTKTSLEIAEMLNKAASQKKTMALKKLVSLTICISNNLFYRINLRRLFLQGFDMTAQCKQGMSPLHVSAMKGYLENVKFLVQPKVAKDSDFILFKDRSV